jgi:hypothetical protein
MSYELIHVCINYIEVTDCQVNINCALLFVRDEILFCGMCGLLIARRKLK